MQSKNTETITGVYSKPSSPSIHSRGDADGDTPRLCLTYGWWLPQIPPLPERIRHIYQQHPTSCGLACVAMVADVTYQTIMKRTNELRVLKKTGYYGTTSRDLIAILKSFDIRTARRIDFASWLDVPQVTIVRVNPSGPHWVVAVRSSADYYIFDPGTEMPNALRRDFGRIHLIGDGIEIISAPGFHRVPRRQLWCPPKLR